ncbi:50S ribosomal protein L19 [Candidatus Saccharibacteria bacterium]|nr:50S ribosomal protein L19 [Candidatus Saccharibacteria bacterium]
MHGLILDLQNDYKKADIVKVRSGDTVRVTQRIKEASKERLQVFEGLIIRTDRLNSLTARITVRKLTFGVGVEKSFLLHSPNVAKVEVVKRAKVRRNYLSYMRDRVGKAARLKGVDFDKEEVNRFSSSQTPFEAAKDTPAETGAVAEEEEKEIADETPAEDEAAAETPVRSEEEEAGDDDDETAGGEPAEEAKGEEEGAEDESETEQKPDADTDKNESA